MKKFKRNTLLAAWIIICFTHSISGQVGYIIGKIVDSSENGIGSAEVVLVSTLQEIDYRSEDNTDSDGFFELAFDWSRINSANERGADWELQITRVGYAFKEKNIFINLGIVDPEEPVVVLRSNIYEKFFPPLSQCASANAEVHTIYLFDLKSSKSNANEIMLLLSSYLNYGISYHLKTHQLLGSEKINIKWCSQVPVEDPEVAVIFGQRLRTPALIWGWLTEESNQIKTRIAFTTLLGDREETAIAPQLSYKKDEDLFNIEESIDKTYLAVSCLILGSIHHQKGNTILARKCFNHTKELDALPNEFSTILNEFIKELESTNVAADLTSITE
jgi:hypothetical protein